MFSNPPQSLTVEWLAQLLAFESVSSVSNEAISDYVAEHLQQRGFGLERHTYLDPKGVVKHNLIARRDPPVASGSKNGRHIAESSVSSSQGRGLAYFSHTDVVPAANWTGPGGQPFQPVLQDARIYGRGACDMKGSLACFLAAIERCDHQAQTSPLWVVCTADEEVGLQGARRMTQSSCWYRQLAEHDPIAVIGEPTRLQVVHAHKGIVGLKIHSRGRAAHSSTNGGINANEAMVPMLQKLLELNERCRTDSSLQDQRFDPPTLTWNFGVSDHATASNIVPDHSVAWVMFRPMPGIDGAELVQEIRDEATRLELELVVQEGCPPLETPANAACIQEFCQLVAPYIEENEPKTVCYASDGAVLTDLSRRVVCGPGDITQAHTSHEYLELEQIERGTQVYADAIRHWCGG